jgi:hypothetical protein
MNQIAKVRPGQEVYDAWQKNTLSNQKMNFFGKEETFHRMQVSHLDQ